MEQLQLELLSEDAWARLAAAESLSPHDPVAQYALRSVLLGDDDARVRVQAAETLGNAPGSAAVDGWLIAGLADPLPSVRDACLRALGSRRAVGAVAECERLITTDSVWWVRRAALLALARIAETAAIPLLRQALGDPFWRVRHAATQALGLIGDTHPAERERIIVQDAGCKPVAAAALWFLRARFDPSIDIHKFRLPERADEPLWNADPAVMTARLRTLSPAEVDPAELVGLLADPHQPLRVLAVQRLSACADLATLRLALRHLEVPGMPHALEATWTLLDGLGDPARVLAAEILADADAAVAALRWAVSWTVRARCEELYPAVAAQAQHADPQARVAVAEALALVMPRNVTTLITLLSDSDQRVREAAILGLCSCDEEAAVQALRDHASADYSPTVRAALVSHAARRRDVAALTAAARDPHARPRSLALAELVHLGAPIDAAASLRDPDPWVRAAALGAVPTEWLSALAADPDVAVRRRVLLFALAQRRTLADAVRSQLTVVTAQSHDPWIRARGCELFVTEHDAALQSLLDLSRDPALMVRAAAASMLETIPDSQQRLRRLLDQPALLSASQRAAAYALLLRDLDESAVALLRATLLDPNSEPALVREQLQATALLLSDEQLQLFPDSLRRAVQALVDSALVPASVPTAPTQMRAVTAPRRPLGRTGLLVSPLAISGAQELSTGALTKAHRAGVNLFFWEPGYAQLTRFLRDNPARRELVIVGGTYEGDRFGITRDVKRALHRLRTDYLDVFLLFWTRSTERLSAEALATLRELKQSGLIRAFGFSTHDRNLATDAIATGDWDVVMTRHSAAHPGAEDRLFPLAVERNVGVLTFSALAYTRLVRPLPGNDKDPALPTAAECYRYSLSQPGVAACLSAPRDHRQLRENLTVLQAPELRLSPERELALRAHGRLVRDQNRRFDALIRKGHEGNQEALAPQQLGELLALLMESAPAPTLELAESIQPLDLTAAKNPRAARRRATSRVRPV